MQLSMYAYLILISSYNTYGLHSPPLLDGPNHRIGPKLIYSIFFLSFFSSFGKSFLTNMELTPLDRMPDPLNSN